MRLDDYMLRGWRRELLEQVINLHRELNQHVAGGFDRRGVTYDPKPKPNVKDLQPVLDIFVVVTQLPDSLAHLPLSRVKEGIEDGDGRVLTDVALPAHHNSDFLFIVDLYDAYFLTILVLCIFERRC